MNKYAILSKTALSLCATLILCLSSISAQDSTPSDFSFQINRVQKYVSISPQQLEEATTLSDLNHYYKADWVKEYETVKITTVQNNVKQVTSSKSDQLTTEQKNLIKSSDLGSEIEVLVTYFPNNNLSNSTIQEMDFTFRIDPDHDAVYASGEKELNQYITENIFSTVTIEDVPQYQVAAIKFTIDEEGEVVDANIAKASQNKEMDISMLKKICEMPKWKSASYADGTKTPQEFVLTVGDHYSCTMNMLDIKSEVPPCTLNAR